MNTAIEYLHGARKYRVSATVIVVRTGGTDRYLNRGALVPADVPQQVIDHLVEHALIEQEV